jgi:CzcA family heavy metal efflux pump
MSSDHLHLGKTNAVGKRAERATFWLARHTKTVYFFTIVLGLAGIYLAMRVPISVFPETNFPRVVIGIDNGVMPVEQMQVLITKPVEDAVNSVPGLVTVRSTTSRGSAEVSLFFSWNEDMVTTLQLVDAALSKVEQTLPSTAQVTTNRLTFATFPILGYSLTSDTTSPSRLWEIATYDLKPPLNRLPGVSTVIVQGGKVPEFQVVPNSAKLLLAGVTIADIVNAIDATNLVESPGLYEADHQLVLGLVGAQVRDAEELGQIVVKTNPAGTPIRIADIADVQSGVQPVYTIVRAKGKAAVLINIARQPSSNTVDVADAVAVEVERLKTNLPPGVHLEPFYDQSQLVRDGISSVRDAILIGIILASIIIVVFLHDWRSSLVAGLVIPITVLVTFVFLKITGQSFNLMTLGGLAAAVGLVIDDAIVVVENIVLHRDSGESRIESVRQALQEITTPLIFSTITPIVVFLPLISVTGVTGTFFRALAITMSVSLLTSLALALTWTPALSLLILRGKNHETNNTAATEETPEAELLKLMHTEEKDLSGFMRRVLEFYEHSFTRAINHRLYLLIACLVLAVGTLIGYRSLGSDLLPEMDEGGFILDYIMPAGSSLTETDRVLQHVESILRNNPNVEIVSRRTGLQMGLAAVTEANSGDITVKLKAKRSQPIDDVMSDLRAEIKSKEPALDIEFIQILQDMISDLSNSPEPIQIKLFNNDPALLAQVGDEVATAIKKLDGVVDVLNGTENTVSGPSTTFRVNPSIASRLGFTAQEVATDATAVIEGVPAANRLIQNSRPYTIRVRFGDEHRASFDSIQNTVLNSSTGKSATLGSLAAIEHTAGEQEIRRENLQRNISVTGRLEGTDLGSGIQRVQAAVAALHLPSSVRIEYGGTYEEQQKTFAELGRVLVLALVLVFGVLLAEFRNLSAPISILTSSILSVSGVVLALLVTRTTFNVASFMGLIMVIGIVAKNGILLLDAYQKFREIGMEPGRAMILAGRRRLRPILMTALAAIAGMLPLAFALGAGSQMLQPLAIAVIGGLVVSMLLSLLVTPVMYLLMHGEAAARAE